MIYHEPKAHTDGDSIVFFRASDVVSTGDIFTPGGYPYIDLERGGGINGEIDALDHILDLTIPGKTQEGGTYVIPGHGRLCDEADVVEFRDMVVIIRDRIRTMISKGMTLEQVKDAKPTLDYDTEYINANSFVKADQFVESIYKSLKESDEMKFALLPIMVMAALPAAMLAQAPAAAAKTPKAAAIEDLTGNWVSIVTEDYRWRMVTPLKGDSRQRSVNAEARKILNAWDPVRMRPPGSSASPTARPPSCESRGACGSPGPTTTP